MKKIQEGGTKERNTKQNKTKVRTNQIKESGVGGGNGHFFNTRNKDSNFQDQDQLTNPVVSGIL